MQRCILQMYQRRKIWFLINFAKKKRRNQKDKNAALTKNYVHLYCVDKQTFCQWYKPLDLIKSDLSKLSFHSDLLILVVCPKGFRYSGLSRTLSSGRILIRSKLVTIKFLDSSSTDLVFSSASRSVRQVQIGFRFRVFYYWTNEQNEN